MELNHKNDLLGEINRLEKAKEINFELLDKKRNDLQEIRKKWKVLKYDLE